MKPIKWTMMLLAAGLAAGCMSEAQKQTYRQAQRAEDQQQYEMQIKAYALPESDKLDCQMRGRAVAVAASNPRSMINLAAEFEGARMEDTCLRMKISKVDEDYDAERTKAAAKPKGN